MSKFIEELEEVKDSLSTNVHVDWEEKDVREEFIELHLKLNRILNGVANGYERAELGKELLSERYVTTCMWSRGDIETYAVKNMKLEELSEEQVDEVAGLMGRRHDASNGVNWEFIEYCIEEVVGK